MLGGIKLSKLELYKNSTIIKDPKNGKYSGGSYIAWNLPAPSIPEDVYMDDKTYKIFWKNDIEKYQRFDVGVGNTPTDALIELERNIKERYDTQAIEEILSVAENLKFESFEYMYKELAKINDRKHDEYMKENTPLL